MLILLLIIEYIIQQMFYLSVQELVHSVLILIQHLDNHYFTKIDV